MSDRAPAEPAPPSPPPADPAPRGPAAPGRAPEDAADKKEGGTGGGSVVPVFFLSYARARTDNVGVPHDANKHVMRLFNDLVEFVDQLVPQRTGADVGFIDREMPGGVLWSPQVRYALGTCQVFVALTSAPYFNSEWCGKEWGGFSRRRIELRQDAQRFSSAIVPVLWAPNHNRWKPRVAEEVQQFTPGPDYDESTYREHGIFGLLTLKMLDEYTNVAWRLAKHIAQIYYGCHVCEQEFNESIAPNAFREAEAP